MGRNPVGWNSGEIAGGAIGEGYTGRIVDPITGAGLLTANTDPATVGVDQLTGADAPSGTDVGFAAALRRYLQVGILNGDFLVPPPDPTARIDQELNPLPYWRWVPSADGAITATWAQAGSGLATVTIAMAAGQAGSDGYLEQWVPIAATGLGLWRYRFAVNQTFTQTGGPTAYLKAQYFQVDAATSSGSETTGSRTTSGSGVLGANPNNSVAPTAAAYVRLRIGIARGVAAVTDTATMALTDAWREGGGSHEAIYIAQSGVPATPATGYAVLYIDNGDGRLYYIDTGGVTRGPL